MIGGHRGRDYRARLDSAVDDPGSLRRLAEADDGDLRRVDDGERRLDAEIAQVRQRDRRIGGSELRSVPRRARLTRSVSSRISVSRSLRSAS
jgi:hypothetical protein